ncbi:bifunctional 4-hydroxy-2-oxoglutarate aldolase/2-dehydro-3-deoxy-phosphogluconate aldolase [Microbacterium sp. PRC9]|uniref:bifunctional 4-hydroxy-2-oxoglutarate aldolase/2-dehydro-3-deoxy-phosphogluconate aldolase n=1 Tax=Microbacterium sp. PRC9 TaxID=2962591 RepID=UPI002880C73D|nr:bifunctional 4-hydroxy-2-oxoglutarate aldolase/2-dehydro-3-deoxy-phosphogluconate aldolase [Microbacterium sp. PRC9]MDT0144521.1 bifunctional 4-hydroxy-2-oxoglutarate aldolase/2-dehydro-3-deoxy-phosphogluconate aldolase [Microbacterium sp. PRC9]
MTPFALPARIIPVVEIEDASAAAPLAAALLAGGLPVAEITLRTPAGIEAIRIIARDYPELTVGAGTVLDERAAEAAVEAGAGFLVSPGFSPDVSQAAALLGVPLVPGAVTATEILACLDAGHRTVKFFPAETAGGLAALRALAAPFAHTGLRFVPTGGIRLESLGGYFAEASVVAVGGTWIATREAIVDGRWADIEEAARVAVATAAVGTEVAA